MDRKRSRRLRQVFGVNGCLRPPTMGFSDSEPRLLAPALIEKVDMPTRERSPYQSRKHTDDAG